MNCFSKAILILAIVLASFSHAEEPKPRERVVLPYKTSLDFFDHLGGPARWQFGQTAVLSLRMWGESTIFLLNGDQEVFRLNAPEYVQAAMLSEEGKTLVVGVNRSIGSGSVFAVLLRVQPDGNNLKVGRVLESERKLFGNTAWGLTELGAVSNDGARLLAKFLVDGGDRWHTVDLTHSKILSEGLTMENAKNPK